jgi:putative ABC transport system ATP-binding protein
LNPAWFLERENETMREASVVLRNVSKRYGEKVGTPLAVRNVTLSIFPGDVTILMGPSGSGKTTLLSMVGGVLSPSAGELNVAGIALHQCNETALQDFRRTQIGFIFQSFNLLSSLTSLENIKVALSLRGADSSSAEKILDSVGLASKANVYPMQLSGGQRQRVGIARALAGDPPLLLADEPTAALDAEHGRRVMRLLRKRAKENGTTVLVVTHDPRVRKFADRVIEMEDGCLKRVVRRARPSVTNDTQWMLTQTGTIVSKIGNKL